MSRRRAAFAVVTALVIVGALRDPAIAHVCSVPVTVTAGEETDIPVTVGIEASPVDKVEIRIPDGIEVRSTPGRQGWKAERDGDVVRFTGGRLPTLQCREFVIRAVVEEPGTVVLPVVVHAEDGSTRRLESDDPNDELAGQILEVEEAEAGSSPAGPVAAAVGATALAALAVWAIRRTGRQRAAAAATAAARRPAKKKRR